MIESLTPYLTKNFRKLEFKFQSGINGNIENIPRWKECVNEVRRRLPVALSAKYIRSTINEDVIKEVNEISESLKTEFLNRMKLKEWENGHEKIRSFQKMATLNTIIGYTEELFLDDKLNEVHKEIDINADEYLLSFLNITRATQNLKFQNLRRVKNKIAWLLESTAVDVVASYNIFSNTIRVPAGLFQGTIFNKNLPKYMNYAGIGFIIGREIGHALFDDGHTMDECFIEQFNNFTVDIVSEMVNGLSTLRNNIADTIGLRYSYAAYLTLLKTMEHAEDRLSGLHYSPEQLYWITFAVNQCSNIREEHLKLWMAKHSISPPEFRVIGSLQNIPSFSFDFGCPSDSQMSFEDHCALW